MTLSTKSVEKRGSVNIKNVNIFLTYMAKVSHDLSTIDIRDVLRQQISAAVQLGSQWHQGRKPWGDRGGRSPSSFEWGGWSILYPLKTFDSLGNILLTNALEWKIFNSKKSISEVISAYRSFNFTVPRVFKH